MPVTKRPLPPASACRSVPSALFFRKCKLWCVASLKNLLRRRQHRRDEACEANIQLTKDPCGSGHGGGVQLVVSDSNGPDNEHAVPAKRHRVAHEPATQSKVHSSAPPSFASIKESQALISRFHTVQKYLAAVEVDRTLSQPTREKRQRQLQAELHALGGLHAYQQASLFGATAEESGAFNSGIWVHNELQAMGLLPPAVGQRRLRLLDVGALQDHWSPHAHAVEAMAIDLNPQHPSVRRADFFDFPPLPAAGSVPSFDAIVLSLVLNFVGDPRRRGVMLERCAALLRPEGALFIVIPAACITNSRYTSHALFLRILHAVGFRLSRHKMTPKLALYALTRSACAATEEEREGLGCRRLCRTGRQRNNFAVLLGGEWGVAAEGNRSKLKQTAASPKYVAKK